MSIFTEDEKTIEFPANTLNPEEMYFSTEDDKMLEDELDKLKDIEKTIILLKDLDGKKFEEISKITDQGVSTVKSLYRRGKIKLAKRLEVIYE